jgi:hypothetical protein
MKAKAINPFIRYKIVARKLGRAEKDRRRKTGESVDRVT